eukprot:CAMPEP_0206148182 /NCGR_PEP_ID=MMETSP1473-20131121/35846_1 /ASSEMBLY_ACC=CAM_ASM_001109 /TAXON_ID=1461547 /ORGANISM="Stichococcus sp, Strain RCC1054" /LENGTH=62 /DNA_ID=CAMNT_0053545431 /DNA_START=51 /DNA_END=239 /DNA_ORIENTATION=+
MNPAAWALSALHKSMCYNTSTHTIHESRTLEHVHTTTLLNRAHQYSLKNGRKLRDWSKQNPA